MGVHRDAALDIAKAIAIIAIVFGHVWRGLAASGLIHDADLFETVDTTVYMWHLTVFAFTAGLFVQHGMNREGAWRYARDRDLVFLWLYVVWSLIQGAVKLIAGAFVNSQTSLGEILRLWVPDGQLWFFGWIALMMILAAATRPWVSRSRATVVIIGAAVGSLALWGVQGPYIGTQGLALTVYFVVALVWRGDRVLAAIRRVPMWLTTILVLTLGVVTVVCGVSGLATPPTTGGSTRTVMTVAFGVVASTAGLFAVLGLARVLAPVPVVARPLSYIGRESMTIFVAHIIFASGSRIVLSRIGVDDPTVQVIAGTLIGVVGPLALHWVALRVHCAWLFDAPRWMKGAGAGRTSKRTSVEE
ncbi:acyltransferase [Microbacterium sp. AK031]|uniref:acyltransferase family protein n=1 Tax=Microbacterium sp. AK031 TaxID=2723076 RepID=UPI0021693038|nr:acyltransferase [Microbacterium sp. AK031]MCS3842582.1 fucose 4-O-acetylase-like acetyltransferase [Microbacterium sp. AK031]